MDFYTITTSLDIDADATLFGLILSAIGFFSQPLIVGDPHPEADSFVFRFAVRDGTIRDHEDDIIANLALSDGGFDASNTTITRAERI